MMSQPFWEVGATYRNFHVQRSVPLPELRMHLLELEHQPTGAKIMRLINDDPENVFCLSFQTCPATSNGVAHILEHTVLCGSKKYPLRDPFFAMTRRSLNTFMNAMTGSDCTFYPAASQVPSDFYNLLDIYLDAVFQPKLEHLSFLQEGHRLEFTTPTDPTTPLEYKGIVYNEMKGAMAAPMSRLFEQVNALLYPDVTYGVNSGGTPQAILKLTHAELCAFHATHYHPSRCLFYFYGNLPTEQHLDFIAERLLDHTTPASPLPPVPSQPRYTTPQSITFSYPGEPSDTPQENTIICWAWLTCSIADQECLLALTLISLIVMDTDASPLKRALLDSKLCKQATLYLDTDNADVPLYLICKGCNATSAQALQDLILATLQDIVQQGIDPAALESALHQLELHRSEITGNSSPYGLTLFSRAGLPRQHGVDAEHALLIHTLFAKLRDRLAAEPRYLENLLSQYVLANHHRVTAVMTPDPALTEQENAAEQAALQALAAKLTAAEKQQLVVQAEQLVAFQKEQEEQDTDLLPIVKLSDIPLESRDYRLDVYADGTLQIFHHACFTNQIVYIDYALPMCAIAEADLPYARLLATLYGQMGCGGRSFNATLEYIQAHTGGVAASFSIYRHTNYLDRLTPQFNLAGKALHRNLDKLCALLKDLTRGIDLTDRDRLKELLLKQWSGLQSTLTQSAMRYASNLAASGLDVAGRISYAWQGLEYYYTIKQLAESIDTALDPLIAKLSTLQAQLLHNDGAHLIISCDAEAFATLQKADYYGLASLPKQSYTPWHNDYQVPSVPNQGRLISAPVAYTCQLLKAVPYTHPDGAALLAASALMDNLSLHHLIREQGGAYGGGTSCSLMGGYFSFYSYRDPNLSATLQAFSTAAHQIAAGDFDEEELFEATLEMFQSMDSPVAPGSRADVAYSWLREAKPRALRQTFRDRVFSLTKQDIVDAVARHILPQLEAGTTVVFANQELFARENGLLKKPLQLLPI